MIASALDVVLVSVELERQRQDNLLEQGVIPWNLTDPLVAPGAKLGVLMEELGEVAKEVNEDGDEKALYTELVQVAACAVAWAEALRGPQSE